MLRLWYWRAADRRRSKSRRLRPPRLPQPPPDKVTADIQAGIERHIEEQIRLGGGYFHLPFRDKQLRLKLVRVHTEYLSKLGPGRHFACVDLADISGDVYDVDFFLAGEPGAMKVTETTVHKINGQPYLRLGATKRRHLAAHSRQRSFRSPPGRHQRSGRVRVSLSGHPAGDNRPRPPVAASGLH